MNRIQLALGVEVGDTATVDAETERLTSAGLVSRPESGACCYAEQDKVWVRAPSGERWEVYTVLADSDTFCPAPGTDAPVCCFGERARPAAEPSVRTAASWDGSASARRPARVARVPRLTAGGGNDRNRPTPRDVVARRL